MKCAFTNPPWFLLPPHKLFDWPLFLKLFDCPVFTINTWIMIVTSSAFTKLEIHEWYKMIITTGHHQPASDGGRSRKLFWPWFWYQVSCLARPCHIKSNWQFRGTVIGVAHPHNRILLQELLFPSVRSLICPPHFFAPSNAHAHCTPI